MDAEEAAHFLFFISYGKEKRNFRGDQFVFPVKTTWKATLSWTGESSWAKKETKISTI